MKRKSSITFAVLFIFFVLQLQADDLVTNHEFDGSLNGWIDAVILEDITPTEGGKIIWVAGNVQDAGGVDSDQGFVDILEAAGYEVQRENDTMTGSALTQEQRDVLESGDLIIISRSTSSGSYNTLDWNTIKTPILNTTSYLSRANRWQWFDNSDLQDDGGAPLYRVEYPEHPVFSGVALDDSNKTAVVDGTVGSGNTSLPLGTDVGNGVLLARVVGTDGVAIAYWNPGIPFHAGTTQKPAGPRMLLNCGARESATEPTQLQGMENLAADGETLFLNAVAFMLNLQIKTNFEENFDEQVDLDFWRPNTLEHEDGTPVFEVSQEDGALKVVMKQLNFPDGQMYDLLQSNIIINLTPAPLWSMKIKVEPGATYTRDGNVNEINQLPFQGSPFSKEGSGQTRQHSNPTVNVPDDGEWHDVLFDWSSPDANKETNPNIYTNITRLLLEVVQWPGTHQATFWIDDFKVGTAVGVKGLVGHWTFDEGSGTVAADASGLGNDGDITGAEWIPGRVGSGALSFDGATTLVNVPHDMTLEITDQLTLSAWCYLESTEGDQDVLQKEYIAIGEIRNAGMANVLNIDDTWKIYNFTVDAAAFLGSWHHIAMTYDGAQVVNYLDGKVDTTFEQTGLVAPTTADMGIGTNNPWQNASWNGDIDDVRMYNVPLSNKEMEALYIATKIKDKTPHIPEQLQLAQNYPNPFNPITTIEFSLPKTDKVRLFVYDIRGRQVDVLMDGQCGAGLHSITFDAGKFASGVYFYRLQTSERNLTKKMMLVK
ncbi:T9SS type A sorting domain-containing protein [candidate division KSB1 bacterium]|nr:T9SS type A sorting domain-containing protein [candidate division KSB1 bacterium]